MHFRDRIAREWNLDVRNELCPPESETDPDLAPASRAAARKTEGLKRLLQREQYAGVIVGIRRDEQATRAKERVFSPRSLSGDWDVRGQPAEFWGRYATDVPRGMHVRIHPLLAWTEVDIWRYTQREEIPFVDLYLVAERRTLSLAWRKEYNASNSEQRCEHRRDHRRARDDEDAGACRPDDGSRQRGFVRASTLGGIHVMSDRPPAIVIVGHVDHGKSTLIGRMLHETGSLPDGKLAELEASSKRRGVPMEWSFVLDALQAERDQAVTVDTTRVWMRAGDRRYAIIDAPGHRQFISNMLSGAAEADAAILMIDVTEGVSEQTRRHAYLLRLLGIEQIVVAVNKMDAAGWSEERFAAVARECTAYFAELEISASAIIPISAYEGANLVARSEDLAWYEGPTLLEAFARLRSAFTGV